MTLYELNERIAELVAEIDALDADVDADTLEGLEKELDEQFIAIDRKREQYVFVIRSADAHAEALRAEARRLSHRAKNMEGVSKRLKGRLHEDMLETGEARANVGLFTLTVAKSPVSVKLEVLPEQLPLEYQRISILSNTARIKQALKNGETIEGKPRTKHPPQNPLRCGTRISVIGTRRPVKAESGEHNPYARCGLIDAVSIIYPAQSGRWSPRESNLSIC